MSSRQSIVNWHQPRGPLQLIVVAGEDTPGHHHAVPEAAEGQVQGRYVANSVHVAPGERCFRPWCAHARPSFT
jgi:hypothetical protein